MNIKWFNRIGVFYTPAKFIGWLIFLSAVAYLIYKFFDIDSRSHSVSDTLMNFIFNAIIIAVVYSAIAFFTSGNKKKESEE